MTFLHKNAQLKRGKLIYLPLELFCLQLSFFEDALLGAQIQIPRL